MEVGERRAYMLSCCKTVELPLHFMTHTMSRETQCGVKGAHPFACNMKGSHEAKVLGFSTHARCSAALAVAATESSGSEAEDSSTCGRREVEVVI
jgi:hypothetical protein